MGTNGITVKPNGKYLARVRTKAGRIGKTFDTKIEAQNWITETKAKDISSGEFSPLMTLDCWFNYWIENLVTDIRINTKLSYISKYNTWIKPPLGLTHMCDIKPYHCMGILNMMKEEGRKASSIDQVRIVMHLIFEYAIENEIIRSNPVTKSVKTTNKILPFTDARFLTRYEELIFLEEAKKHKHYDVFRFILETGLRYGELTGLQWEDVDLDRRIITIRRSASFLEDYGDFVVGPPKSANGYRDIYLTKTAMDILSGLEHKGVFVFPTEKRSTYNMQLKRICKICGLEPFSIHKLRHSFATRCIESGMKPKTLQKILGHSDVTITLNYYVHVSDNEMANAMEAFSGYQMGTKVANMQ